MSEYFGWILEGFQTSYYYTLPDFKNALFLEVMKNPLVVFHVLDLSLRVLKSDLWYLPSKSCTIIASNTHNIQLQVIQDKSDNLLDIN